MLHDPDIVLFDEPFSGVDPIATDAMRNAILGLAEAGKTVLFSSHLMEQAERICHDVVIIDQPEASHSRCSKIERGRGSQPAGPDAQDRGFRESDLSFHSKAREGEVSFVTCLFAFGEHDLRDLVSWLP